MLVDFDAVNGKDEVNMAIEAKNFVLLACHNWIVNNTKWVLIAVGAAVLGIIACYFLVQLVIYIMYVLVDLLTKGMR